MSEQRPRTFCWVWGLRGPNPQILFDDPRVGPADLPIIAGTAIKLRLDETRSLDQLAHDHPAPEGV